MNSLNVYTHIPLVDRVFYQAISKFFFIGTKNCNIVKRNKKEHCYFCLYRYIYDVSIFNLILALRK